MYTGMAFLQRASEGLKMRYMAARSLSPIGIRVLKLMKFGGGNQADFVVRNTRPNGAFVPAS